MQTTAHIREAAAEELPEIAGRWLAMFEEAGKHREIDFSDGWRERFAAYFAERVGGGDACYYVAEDRGRIIGTAGALLTESYPAVIHGLRIGYIFGVYVDPAFRSRGIARRLTEAAVSYLRSRNPYAIRLHASRAGRPIYERMGFEPTNEMQLADHSTR